MTPAQALLAPIRAGWNLGNTLDAMKRGWKPGETVTPLEITRPMPVYSDCVPSVTSIELILQ